MVCHPFPGPFRSLAISSTAQKWHKNWPASFGLFRPRRPAKTLVTLDTLHPAAHVLGCDLRSPRQASAQSQTDFVHTSSADGGSCPPRSRSPWIIAPYTDILSTMHPTLSARTEQLLRMLDAIAWRWPTFFARGIAAASAMRVPDDRSAPAKNLSRASWRSASAVWSIRCSIRPARMRSSACPRQELERAASIQGP